MREWVVGFLVLGLHAVAAGEEPAGPRVIFSAEAAAEADIPLPMRRGWKPFWSPTAQHVANLESKLASYLEQTQPKIARDLGDYGIQFFGITLPGGERDRPPKKAIAFNAFCKYAWSDLEEEWWRESYGFALGGGTCYFAGTFDHESGQIMSFHVNEPK
ncbi:MAG: hypothetical protein ACQGVC_05765 [Myxococcota bacterium]